MGDQNCWDRNRTPPRVWRLSVVGLGPDVKIECLICVAIVLGVVMKRAEAELYKEELSGTLLYEKRRFNITFSTCWIIKVRSVQF